MNTTLSDIDSVRQAIDNASPGEKVVVHCPGEVIKELKEQINGLSWRQYGLYEFHITRSEVKMSNAKREIELICSRYRTGRLEVPKHPPVYVRTVVSAFNRKNGTAYRVTVKDGTAYIYTVEGERKFITQDDFDQIVQQYREELAELRKLVRPDEFFEMMDESYDNGVPEPTEADLISDEVQPSKPEFPKVVNCEGCGITMYAYHENDTKCDPCIGNGIDDDYDDII